MSRLFKHINAILITIILHLAVLIFAMLYKLNNQNISSSSYMYVMPEFLDNTETKTEEELNEEKLEDIDIENYIGEIRNIGSSSKITSTKQVESMSQEELKLKYETEILAEKYGQNLSYNTNNANKNTSTTTLNKDKQDIKNKENTQINKDNINSNYSGAALVFVDLENKNRSNVHVHVPVFTCKDGGSVIIKISVASNGSVKNANLVSAKSSVIGGNTECIVNEARQAALKSQFTSIAGASIEYGTITYQFIQQ